MIDYSKYIKDEDDLGFLLDLRTTLLVDQMPVALDCNGYGFQIDPGAGGAVIWRLGKEIAAYASIDDLFFNFKINGKTFIEKIGDIDYA